MVFCAIALFLDGRRAERAPLLVGLLGAMLAPSPFGRGLG